MNFFELEKPIAFVEIYKVEDIYGWLILSLDGRIVDNGFARDVGSVPIAYGRSPEAAFFTCHEVVEERCPPELVELRDAALAALALRQVVA